MITEHPLNPNHREVKAEELEEVHLEEGDLLLEGRVMEAMMAGKKTTIQGINT